MSEKPEATAVQVPPESVQLTKVCLTSTIPDPDRPGKRRPGEPVDIPPGSLGLAGIVHGATVLRLASWCLSMAPVPSHAVMVRMEYTRLDTGERRSMTLALDPL